MITIAITAIVDQIENLPIVVAMPHLPPGRGCKG